MSTERIRELEDERPVVVVRTKLGQYDISLSPSSQWIEFQYEERTGRGVRFFFGNGRTKPGRFHEGTDVASPLRFHEGDLVR